MKLGTSNKIRSLSPRGFSLIELMVAVSLVGILSATAVPSMMKYMSDAKTAEAAVILADGGKEQERAFVMRGEYTDVLATSNPEKIAISTRFSKSRFNLMVGGYTQAGEVYRFDQLDSASHRPAQNTKIAGQYNGDYIMAVEGDTDNDSNLTVIAMNKSRALITLCDDFSNSNAASFGDFWAQSTSQGGSFSQPGFSCVYVGEGSCEFGCGGP